MLGSRGAMSARYARRSGGNWDHNPIRCERLTILWWVSRDGALGGVARSQQVRLFSLPRRVGMNNRSALLIVSFVAALPVTSFAGYRATAHPERARGQVERC